MIRLTVRHQTQPDSEEILDFDKDVVTLGRQADNDVVLGERTVSRKHARIEIEGDHYVIRDLESHFGVFVNKRKIAVEEIGPGSEIYITPFIIQFDLVSAGAAAAAAEAPGDLDATLGPAFAPGPPPEDPNLPTGPYEAPEPAYDTLGAPPEPEYTPPDALAFDAPPAPEFEAALPPPPEPEPEPLPDPLDHLADLPGLGAPPLPPQGDEGAEVPEDETLMRWDGSSQSNDAPIRPAAPPSAPAAGTRMDFDGPAPFQVDEGPAPAPEIRPPEPKKTPPRRPPVRREPTPEPSGFKPWDSASSDEEPEEDILEEVRPRPRRDSGPLNVEDQIRGAEIVDGRKYGRIRGGLLGFLLLLLPFFPVAQVKGSLSFFWGQTGAGLLAPEFFPFLGAGILGLLLVAASLFGSGLVRGLLQAVFAGAFLGVAAGVVFAGRIETAVWHLDLTVLARNGILLGLAGGFFLAVLGCRLKIFHPRKILVRVLNLFGAAGLLAFLFVPPSAMGLEGPSFFGRLLEAFAATSPPFFWIANTVLLALIGLLALSNLPSWRSTVRSRVALLAAFYLLVYPAVNLFVEVARAGFDHFEPVPFVHELRLFLIAFLALWAFIVGLASFIGNLLVAMNYNEMMILERS